MKLDLPDPALHTFLGRAVDVGARFFVQDDERDRDIFPVASRQAVRAAFAGGLPEDGTAPEALLDEVEREIFGRAARAISPNWYALVTSGGNPFGMAAELLAAALDQNVLKEATAPVATAVERQVLRWIASFIGYPDDAGGILVSGGSMANFVALAAARAARAPYDVGEEGCYGRRPFTLYGSTETHHSLAKAVGLMGLGRRQLRRIRVDDDFRIDVEALRAAIHGDREKGFVPLGVVANGGTVNTGAVDPLDALADVCREEDLWLHVDAAYGGPAAGTDVARRLFDGLHRADSVAIDPHKWFYVPFDVGCTLVRDSRHLAATFGSDAAYAASDNADHDFMRFGPQMSRGFRALKVWMTFKGYGARALREAIQENVETMRYLAGLIDDAPDFERMAPVPLSIVCFRYRPPQGPGDDAALDELNQRLLDAVRTDGRVFLMGTKLRGRTVLRACNVKYRTERRHVLHLLEVLRALGEQVMEGQP